MSVFMIETKGEELEGGSRFSLVGHFGWWFCSDCEYLVAVVVEQFECLVQSLEVRR